MSKTEAAYKILKDFGKPMHVKEITKIALEKGMIQTTGKTPATTMNADIYLENKRKEKLGREKRFVKVSSGVWGLTEW